ncbi:MAG TPA: PQQ-binding-like beta-propeller repeat protein [Lacipirellulaceae bacterium]|nr:PQQ-binding-like beta-propeller repeat protein [Lacipirellulaceae bacterium]
MRCHIALFFLFSFSFVWHGTDSIAAENWPQWRGPLGTGVAHAGNYPVTFSNTEGVAWKADLPGLGTSTPAVWADHIFVTCGIKGQDGIVCYDMKGKELWHHVFGPERAARNRNASGSNPSPVTDGQRLVVYYKSGTLASLDLAGHEKWKTNLQDRFGKDTLWWDLGTSPVLADGLVIVAVMQAGDSYLVAFDLKTGDLAWRTPRKYECPEESDQSYSTPQVVPMGGKNVIVTWGADHLTGHDAATGKLLWECGGFNPDQQANLRTIASVAASDTMAVVPYARGASLAGIRLGGNGDVTKTARVWEKNGRRLSADVPTPVVANGKVYLLTDAGHIDCLNLQSGEVLWSADLPRNRNRYYASPILAGDKLYCTRIDGVISVGRVSDKGFELLADNNDMGERIIATPVPIRGGLLIRGDDHLFYIAPRH